MKLKYVIEFDPEVIAPKDVRAALKQAGVSEDGIKLGGTREASKAPAKPRAVSTPKSS